MDVYNLNVNCFFGETNENNPICIILKFKMDFNVFWDSEKFQFLLRDLRILDSLFLKFKTFYFVLLFCTLGRKKCLYKH